MPFSPLLLNRKKSLVRIFSEHCVIKSYAGNPNVPTAGNLKPRDSNPMLSIVISDPSSGHSKSARMKKS